MTSKLKRRTYEEEQSYIEKGEKAVEYRIRKGFVNGMNVPGVLYVNKSLEKLIFAELMNYTRQADSGSAGGFLPAVKQIGNVASLPGIVKHSIGLPDVHAGYGFAIGNVAAFDTNNPEAVVSPGIAFSTRFLLRFPQQKLRCRRQAQKRRRNVYLVGSPFRTLPLRP